jgi:hypothetical protein
MTKSEGMKKQRRNPGYWLSLIRSGSVDSGGFAAVSSPEEDSQAHQEIQFFPFPREREKT